VAPRRFSSWSRGCKLLFKSRVPSSVTVNTYEGCTHVDAGFGRRTKGIDVASRIVELMRERDE